MQRAEIVNFDKLDVFQAQLTEWNNLGWGIVTLALLDRSTVLCILQMRSVGGGVQTVRILDQPDIPGYNG